MNSTLDLSALTTLGNMTNWWYVEALAGGTLNLSGLTAINEPNAPLQFEADGSGSQLNLSALTSLTAGTGSSTLAVTDSGSVLAEQPDHLQRCPDHPRRQRHDRHQPVEQLDRRRSLTVTGGSYSLAGLTNVNGSSLYAEGGGSLALPNLKTYTETDNTTFEATGVNSTLDLSALTTLESMTNWWYVEALAGGTLNLSGLTAINEPSAPLHFEADGSGSQLNLSALTSFTASDWTVNATNGGEVNLSGLTSLSGTYGSINITDTGSSTLTRQRLDQPEWRHRHPGRHRYAGSQFLDHVL